MPTTPEAYHTRLRNKQFSTATGIQATCRRCGQDVLKVEPKPGWVVIVNADGHYHWPDCPGPK